MSKSLQPDSARGHKRIATVAHTLWEQAGRPPERDLEFWLMAEQQVVARRRGSSGRRNARRA